MNKIYIDAEKRLLFISIDSQIKSLMVFLHKNILKENRDGLVSHGDMTT